MAACRVSLVFLSPCHVISRHFISYHLMSCHVIKTQHYHVEFKKNPCRDVEYSGLGPIPVYPTFHILVFMLSFLLSLF